MKLRMESKTLWLTAGAVFVAMAGLVTLSYIAPAKTAGLSFTLKRIRGSLAYYVLDRTPRVYALTAEKNGQDFLISETGPFEVTSRDEFVIKDITSDALSPKRFRIDVIGVGGPDDFRVLLRGIDFVDQAVTHISEETMARGYVRGEIRVGYEQKVVAVMPVRIRIMPQDWLRYAKASSSPGKQIEYLKRASAANPQDPAIRRVLGEIYRHAGRFREAESEFQAVLSRKPDDVKAIAGLMKTYLASGRDDLAMKAGLRAVRIEPGEPALWEDLALACIRLGSWQAAADASRSLLKINPGNDAARIRLAEIYEKLGRESEAIEQYRLVTSKGSGAASNLEGLARMYLKQGKYDESIRLLNNLIREKSPSAAVYANLGLAYGGKRMWKEELESYRKAAALRPNDPIILYNLGVALEHNNREREAMNAYERVLKIKPNDTEAMLKLGDLAFRNKQYQKAVGLYEKLAGKVPQKGALYANLGYAYGELKQWSSSAKYYEKAIQAGVKDDKVTYNLAATYEKMGKEKSAVALYEKSAARNPSADALNRMADYYIKTAKYDQAIRVYQKMLKSDARNAGIYADLGYVYGLKGNPDKEIECYKTSLRYNSEESDVHSRLGGAYEKKGLLEEALRAYTKAYQLNPHDARAAERIPQLKIRLIREKHERENKKGA